MIFTILNNGVAMLICLSQASCQGPEGSFTVRRMQESRTYWFNPASLEAEDEFMLIGLVLSLAIYNAVLLDFPLPLALYKKLIGQPVVLRDLEDMEPTLGRSLRQLLQYEGEYLPAPVL